MPFLRQDLNLDNKFSHRVEGEGWPSAIPPPIIERVLLTEDWYSGNSNLDLTDLTSAGNVYRYFNPDAELGIIIQNVLVALYDPMGLIDTLPNTATDEDGNSYVPKGTTMLVIKHVDTQDGHYEPLVIIPQGGDIKRGQLTEDLYTCGEASAVEIIIDANGNKRNGKEFQVFDLVGKVGGELLAILDDFGDEYIPSGTCGWFISMGVRKPPQLINAGSPLETSDNNWYEPLGFGQCCEQVPEESGESQESGESTESTESGESNESGESSEECPCEFPVSGDALDYPVVTSAVGVPVITMNDCGEQCWGVMEINNEDSGGSDSSNNSCAFDGGVL